MRRRDLLYSLADLDDVDVAFAATVDPGARTFVLDRFVGARTDQLRDVRSSADCGLGGKCIAMRRPVFVRDYTAARGISHDFDRQVTGEGLRAILAVPVLGSDGRVLEVVYGAARRAVSFGERLIDKAVDLVGRSAVGAQPITDTPLDDHRSLAGTLTEIADDIQDPALRRRLREVVDRLRVTGTGAASADAAPAGLSRREVEVLAEVARGLGNREVGERLGLTEQTVKSYLKNAMFKLDSRTRGEAVFRARNAGILR